VGNLALMLMERVWETPVRYRSQWYGSSASAGKVGPV
jgi:hypothetical protein